MLNPNWHLPGTLFEPIWLNRERAIIISCSLICSWRVNYVFWSFHIRVYFGLITLHYSFQRWFKVTLSVNLEWGGSLVNNPWQLRRHFFNTKFNDFLTYFINCVHIIASPLHFVLPNHCFSYFYNSILNLFLRQVFFLFLFLPQHFIQLVIKLFSFLSTIKWLIVSITLRLAYKFLLYSWLIPFIKRHLLLSFSSNHLTLNIIFKQHLCCLSSTSLSIMKVSDIRLRYIVLVCSNIMH